MQSCILMARWWRGPKALCELQGYVYNAWVRMAEVFDALGKPERGTELRAKAAALFARFNDAFQDAELGFYAYALDGDVAAKAEEWRTAGYLTQTSQRPANPTPSTARTADPGLTRTLS